MFLNKNVEGFNLSYHNKETVLINIEVNFLVQNPTFQLLGSYEVVSF